MKSLTAIISLMSCCAVFAIANAQQAELSVSPDDFSESFMGAAEVSSAGVLVGYSVGTDVDWKANQIPVAIPNNYDGELCLRASSLDGRFWSFNPYRISASSTKVELGPVSRGFMQTLRRMPDSYMALRASTKSGDGCDDLREVRFFPVIGATSDEISFLVNSSGRKAYARIRFDEDTVTEVVECTQITDVIPVAADKRCTLEPSDRKGQAQVEFAFIGSTGQPEVLQYEISVP
ncbi:hypothetical protein [Henriciella mobilis]|uniref:hypothetical protein n=1 Tax=Henriciella mobilis TaxID=2305467 RepID=UPI0011C4323A|nr:hypothetical protein [Henriciella mobilis]